MDITTIGIDLAKDVFRTRVLKYNDDQTIFARSMPCLIGIEACVSSTWPVSRVRELWSTMDYAQKNSAQRYTSSIFSLFRRKACKK